ncbi:hypothetical protein O1611_g10458 [Lasiodiplodia mahajangana]|uniref:Uncharacterized protein n=1 Tax=Lasiodiplodia mahajangana TaxID=1108764 RepID=A0ACC2IY25_9PEZI|nr:hypothetical protein O1611_g10458 [Lasiodiplodia mahajangana]
MYEDREANNQEYGDYEASARKYDDPMEIDSPEERRRQLQGCKAEATLNLIKIERAEEMLGSRGLADFDGSLQPISATGLGMPESTPKAPEFTPNQARDKSYTQVVEMNHTVSMDGMGILFPTVNTTVITAA